MEYSAGATQSSGMDPKLAGLLGMLALIASALYTVALVGP